MVNESDPYLQVHTLKIRGTILFIIGIILFTISLALLSEGTQSGWISALLLFGIILFGMGILFFFIAFGIWDDNREIYGLFVEKHEKGMSDEEFNKHIQEKRISEEIDRMQTIREKRSIREEAEKRLYGKVKNKRITLNEEEKEMIFDKFNNKCALCNAVEGLHIHHKDKNPKNNNLENLIVLCGVCHKKVHMKVR